MKTTDWSQAMTPVAKPAGFIEMMLTCVSWQEAQRVADHLLGKHLIGHAEFIPLQRREAWQETRAGGEVKLIMETAEHLRDEVAAELAALVNYERSVLQSVPVARLTGGAGKWLRGPAAPFSGDSAPETD